MSRRPGFVTRPRALEFTVAIMVKLLEEPEATLSEVIIKVGVLCAVCCSQVLVAVCVSECEE